jgi:hypothetical protein
MREMTAENDIVLIYFEEKPLSFARVEDISPDVKPGWYQIKLLMLQVPLQLVTWILRDAYINGTEFTMNGKRMRLEKVVSPLEQKDAAKEGKAEAEIGPKSKHSGDTKVISLKDLKKKSSE